MRLSLWTTISRPASKSAYPAPVNTPAAASRAPSREEVDTKFGETQQKLAELKRAQEELERERAGLEEIRRRQLEFQNGRQETIQNLTRGIGFVDRGGVCLAAGRGANGRNRSPICRWCCAKVEATNEQALDKGEFRGGIDARLDRGAENARMEWRCGPTEIYGVVGRVAARRGAGRQAGVQPGLKTQLADQRFGPALQTRTGAFTWPLAAVALLVGLLMIFLRR